MVESDKVFSARESARAKFPRQVQASPPKTESAGVRSSLVSCQQGLALGCSPEEDEQWTVWTAPDPEAERAAPVRQTTWNLQSRPRNIERQQHNSTFPQTIHPHTHTHLFLHRPNLPLRPRKRHLDSDC